MPNNPPRFGFCVVFIFAMACGPLVPLSYEREIPTSPRWQTIKTEEATVFLEYITKENLYYIFDLEIINHSPSEIFLAPQFISFYASPKLFKPLYDSTDNVHDISRPNSALTMKRQFANSPEMTQKIYHEKLKTRAAGAVLFALIGVAAAIYDADKDAEDSKKESWSKKDDRKAFARDLLVDAALISSEISKEAFLQAKEDRQYIPYELFPACTIKPGQSVRGKIFIPIESSYRYSRIVVPLTDADYIFDFKRQGVKTTRSQLQHHPSVDAQRR
jgi:hypothetical protein